MKNELNNGGRNRDGLKIEWIWWIFLVHKEEGSEQCKMVYMSSYDVRERRHLLGKRYVWSLNP